MIFGNKTLDCILSFVIIILFLNISNYTTRNANLENEITQKRRDQYVKRNNLLMMIGNSYEFIRSADAFYKNVLIPMKTKSNITLAICTRSANEALIQKVTPWKSFVHDAWLFPADDSDVDLLDFCIRYVSIELRHILFSHYFYVKMQNSFNDRANMELYTNSFNSVFSPIEIY